VNFCHRKLYKDAIVVFSVILDEAREKSLSSVIIAMERLMIFIDGENLFRSSRDEGIKISFSKLIGFLSRGFNLIRVYYYTGIPTQETWNRDKEAESEFKSKLSKQIKFLDKLALDYNFHVVTRPLVLDKGLVKEKGIDVNIASDIVWHGLSDNYDAFVLISGDRDLIECLERMKDNGKRVIIANFERNISREIKKIADRYVNLSASKEEIKLNF
jgi:uncharacterized LabA/DUF88 family protein